MPPKKKKPIKNKVKAKPKKKTTSGISQTVIINNPVKQRRAPTQSIPHPFHRPSNNNNDLLVSLLSKLIPERTSITQPNPTSTTTSITQPNPTSTTTSSQPNPTPTPTPTPQPNPTPNPFNSPPTPQPTPNIFTPMQTATPFQRANINPVSQSIVTTERTTSSQRNQPPLYSWFSMPTIPTFLRPQTSPIDIPPIQTLIPYQSDNLISAEVPVATAVFSKKENKNEEEEGSGGGGESKKVKKKPTLKDKLKEGKKLSKKQSVQDAIHNKQSASEQVSEPLSIVDTSTGESLETERNYTIDDVRDYLLSQLPESVRKTNPSLTVIRSKYLKDIPLNKRVGIKQGTSNNQSVKLYEASLK